MIGFFSRMAGAVGGSLHNSTEGIRICSGVPFPIFNWVFRNRFSEEEIDSAIHSTLEHFRARGVPFCWGIFPNDHPRQLKEKLQAMGFVAEEAPAMAIDLDRLPPPPSTKDLKIEPVLTQEQVRVFAQTLNSGDFHASERISRAIPDVLRPSLSPTVGEGDVRCFVGYLDGTPVATSAYFLCGGVVGIYGIATVPSARRRGFGATMTLAALEDGRTLDCREGVLIATTMGEPLYRRLGFRELFRATQVEIPTDRPAPKV
ncbi:MAG: GNAT family N-acetyltransferase [Thermoplasmata archaeon]|nr:GNAT family N-acetyltransferase [Thermoplasmata archaeon]